MDNNNRLSHCDAQAHTKISIYLSAAAARTNDLAQIRFYSRLYKQQRSLRNLDDAHRNNFPNPYSHIFNLIYFPIVIKSWCLFASLSSFPSWLRRFLSAQRTSESIHDEFDCITAWWPPYLLVRAADGNSKWYFNRPEEPLLLLKKVTAAIVRCHYEFLLSYLLPTYCMYK